MRSVDLEPHVSLSVCTENKASWVASWASAPAPGGLALTGASVAKSPVIMERGWWVCLVPWSRLRSRHPRCPPRWLSRDRAPLPTCTPRLAARAECGGRSERVGKRARVALHGPRGGSGLAPGQAGPEPRRRRAASQGSRWARLLPHVGGHGLPWTAAGGGGPSASGFGAGVSLWKAAMFGRVAPCGSELVPWGGICTQVASAAV